MSELKDKKILKNKNAIITGVRRGIGRATVEKFASYGANIWACARKYNEEFEQDMKKIAEENNVEIWPIYFELTKEDEIIEAVKTIKKQDVSVDVLVNMAGFATDGSSFQMTPIEKMKEVFNVNFFGTTLLTQYVSRIMTRQNSGNIVNVSSVAAIDGTPAQYEYAASKAALIGATKVLARELSPNNIRVNAVAPGMTDTDMGAQIDADLKNELLNQVIMNRLAKPEEIADAIAFLSSDMSGFITGQVVRVDGGI